MKPKKQRMAIAKACGWTDIRPQMLVTGTSLYASGKFHGTRKDGSKEYFVPNYLTDLNAMHEAEKVLTPHQHISYWSFLSQMDDYKLHGKSILTATAAQRAEAFLKTLGLWE